MRQSGPSWRPIQAFCGLKHWVGREEQLNLSDVASGKVLKVHTRVTAKGYVYHWSGGAVQALVTVLAIYVATAVRSSPRMSPNLNREDGQHLGFPM